MESWASIRFGSLSVAASEIHAIFSLKVALLPSQARYSRYVFFSIFFPLQMPNISRLQWEGKRGKIITSRSKKPSIDFPMNFFLCCWCAFTLKSTTKWRVKLWKTAANIATATAALLFKWISFLIFNFVFFLWK